MGKIQRKSTIGRTQVATDRRVERLERRSEKDHEILRVVFASPPSSPISATTGFQTIPGWGYTTDVGTKYDYTVVMYADMQVTTGAAATNSTYGVIGLNVGGTTLSQQATLQAYTTVAAADVARHTLAQQWYLADIPGSTVILGVVKKQDNSGVGSAIIGTQYSFMTIERHLSTS